MTGAYSSLTQNNGSRDNIDRSTPGGQSFRLQDQLGGGSGSASVRRDDDNDNDSFLGSDSGDRSPRREFRVTFKDNNGAEDAQSEKRGRTNVDDYSSSEDEDDDEDLDNLDDFVPLASTKRYQSKSSSSPSRFSRVSHPCKILATVCGTATVVSLAFALLSLLHLNNNQSLNQGAGQSNDTTTAIPIPDNRFLKPPAGLTMEEFNVADFHLPPWDWDINKFVPIDITNGPKFTSIQWRNGEQYLTVDCPHQPNYRYHFPSFPKDEFRNHPTVTHGIDDLLHIGNEPYVFVLCPPGQNNANLVFREFDVPEEEVPPESPPHIAGTQEAPQPLVDDVVMLLVDAISRGKFLAAMVNAMEALQAANTTDSRYQIFDFQHYNVLGQNSPPNKAFIYSGQSIENMNHGPKHWIWDTYEEQGFTTAHTDGECGGRTGIHDYISGAITYEYTHIFGRIPAQYQMSQPSWCENHDMHVVSNIWGQSCRLPPQVHYDKDLMGGMRWNTPYCAGHKAIHEFIMDDLEGWLVSKKGKRRFATYSFMDAHSPDHHHISFDKHLATFIRKLLIGQDGQPPLLSPKSALVIMADHGLHYGRETYTFPGFLHHKIPPLFMALPKTLLEERPALARNLEDNQGRIISHLDLHQTFHHLAYGDFPVTNNGPNQSQEQAYSDFMTKFIADGTFRRQFHATAPNQTSYAQQYGRSLLLPIDEKRTCITAGIPQDWCAFQPFLDLDPSKPLDARFMRGALLMLSNRMNNITRIHHVDDVCHPASLSLQPESPPGLLEDATLRGDAVWNGTFDDIGTQDLVMESAYANAEPSKGGAAVPYVYDVHNLAAAGTRVFYFMVRDRHRPNRKYSVTMRQDDLERGVGDRITIQQMSAYAAAWGPCSAKISQGGKAIGDWHDTVKHFCVCD
ncbi:MAG: hypothetical protein J3R72DRAFT_451082 [Linnemannia gamsii]|nr:MAG: hypothetical protein J3R72DRAFT_451082 [Linnemannia gamsii]